MKSSNNWKHILKKLTWNDGLKQEKKNWEKNEGTLHNFNNCKVLANLNLVTVVTIFSSKIVELLGHYILVQAMVIQTHISMHSIKEKRLLCGRASKFAIDSKYQLRTAMSCDLYVGKTLAPIFFPILTCTSQCNVVDNTHINFSRYEFQGILFKWRQSYFSGAL
jgi:hypothetical protein